MLETSMLSIGVIKVIQHLTLIRMSLFQAVFFGRVRGNLNPASYFRKNLSNENI